ncbi:MAG: transposase [Betaproteobacteria bacterium]|nr:transposase [Betaproteobacteria bacterium]
MLLALKRRDLVIPPWLAVGDGVLGFCAALKGFYPEPRHQRCCKHKTANILDYLPKPVQLRAKAALAEIIAGPNEDRCFDKIGRAARRRS